VLLFLLLALHGEPAQAKLSAAGRTHKLQALEKALSDSVTPCDPVSECFDSSLAGEPHLEFCARWNPDFLGNDKSCCGPLPRRRRVQRTSALIRKKRSRCDEMTSVQKEYSALAEQGKLGDILSLIKEDRGKYGDQAICTVNNGFLAYGRRIVPTSENRILINSPGKCTNFGTDPMAGMIEWLGRIIGRGYSAKPYQGVRLVIGDVSGPRGGSHYGPSGLRGHASHTNGQDADIGFLTVKQGQETPSQFTRQFNSAGNWWMLKQIFKNPYACIKVIFLDRRHINALAKFASKDPEWKTYKKFIRHMPSHKNHLHVRIGNGPGQPGCGPNARPELEFGEDMVSDEALGYDDGTSSFDTVLPPGVMEISTDSKAAPNPKTPKTEGPKIEGHKIGAPKNQGQKTQSPNSKKL
jgi:murein endopeptidase